MKNNMKSRPDQFANRLFVLAAPVIFSVIVGAGTARQDMNAAIDKAVTKYATVKTARGTFAQTNTTEFGTHNLTGEFQQQFPNLVSLRYSEPKGDMIVADGKFTWAYFPNSIPGVVTRVSLGSANLNLIGAFLDSPRTKYTLSDSGRQVVSGFTTRMIGLVPRQPQKEFRRATVWIEESTGIIRQFEITQPNGTISRFNFKTLELNASVDASRFRFTVPRGVKVDSASGR